MARTPVWKSITSTLEAEIGQGHYQVGEKIPTEAELAQRFGVNRHTVRRALGEMAERGILRSRRGAGVFVESPPTDYPIGRRVRFHQNIRATGRLPDKQMLRLETRPAVKAEAQALAIKTGDPVVVHEGLSLIGGAPIAHFSSLFPKTWLPGLQDSLQKVRSVTEALRLNGVDDYIRAETRISAQRATATLALHLRLREGDPVLKSVGINTTTEGRPVEFGTSWFAGERITLTVAND